MKSFAAATVAAIILGAPAVLGAPTVASPLKKVSGPVKPDSYIVVLKPTASKESHLASLQGIAARSTSSYQQVTADWSPEVLHGYAATLKGDALTHVLSSPDVLFVEPDGIVSINFVEKSTAVERDLTAEVIDEREVTKKASGGAGVSVYGIDTGIYTGHTCFGGRASFGAVYGGYAAQDGNGHGTHTAGTAVGKTYGVATSASIIAVKVLSDSGSGSNSDVVSGINYAYNQYRSTGRPSVATMSLGGGANSAVDSAVSKAIGGGLHFSVAAGNDNQDASNTSPARVSAANTIGAIDSGNKKASFSNYGSVVDVWALGVNVVSAWITSSTSTNTLSGTSMATPRVAGYLAVALGEYGSVSPASLSSSLKKNAQAVVSGQPSGTTNLKAVQW